LLSLLELLEDSRSSQESGLEVPLLVSRICLNLSCGRNDFEGKSRLKKDVKEKAILINFSRVFTRI
jgi:hypothetical protein